MIDDDPTLPSTEGEPPASRPAPDPSASGPGAQPAHRLSPADAYRLAIESFEAPRRIGPYHLLRRVGDGGMGEVWEAEQLEPMRRRVAVKLVKLGMDTRQFIARFESERQALALMDHPAIARVIDGGATETGRPYFVMEYVEGAAITEHCDRRRLSIDERLGLFLAVCQGVQHAHQKGVIHRDLKPTNVLVDDSDRPRIIDFGVAKATTETLTERTLHTALGGWIGTPAYMSPEQAEITGEGIDTRTDVYSLGVVLYELLTGFGPFDEDRLEKASVEEIRRLIREVEPPRPSARVRAAGERALPAAARRRTDPRTLARRLEGDLDWIVMRAIEKEKERRYGSPAELAADLRRHLSSEPVAAGPPSALYRARKFVRRHRGLVAAGAAVVVALVAAVAGTTAGLVRARTEARRASEAAATAEATAAFLAGLFRAGDPTGAEGGADLTARDLLERGSARLATELADQPATRARLLETIGVVYRNLGLVEESERSLREAVALRQAGAAGAGEGDVERDRHLASALLELSVTLKDRGEFDEAAQLLERATAIMDAALEPGDRLRLSILTNTGLLHRDRADPARAQPALEQALAEARAVADLPPAELATMINNLALHYRSGRDATRAEPLFEEAIATAESAPDPDEFTLAVMYNNLGLVYLDQGRRADARPMYEKSLALLERRLGDDHPRVAVVLHNYGDLLRENGDFEQAGAAYARSRRILEARLGPDHPNVATSLIGSAQLLAATGRLAEAAAELERAVSIREAAFGAESPRLREPLELYAGVLRRLGRDREAAAIDSRLAAL